MIVRNKFWVGIFLTFLQLVSVCLAVRVYDPEIFEQCDPSGDCSDNAISGCATIFQARNYGGWKQCIPLSKDECITLSDWWQVGGGRLSAVDTHGTCVRLYDEMNCQGYSFQATQNSSSDHSNLSEIGWEDVAKSISSCDRQSTYKCTVKYLFGSKISDESLSDISNRGEEIAKAVFTAVGSSVGGYFPGANVALNIIQLIDTINSGGDPYPALIEAKVAEGIAQNAAAQIKAKTGIIENWLRTITLANTTESDRKIELLIALHTCEEVFLLFQDPSYAFSANKVLSSPYLVTFSNIYLGLARILYDYRYDLRPKLKQDMVNLARLNQEYLKVTKINRTSQFKAENDGSCAPYALAQGLPCGPVIADKLISKNYDICELKSEHCQPTGNLDTYKRCVEDLKQDIALKLDNFFTPTIDRLNNFGNY